MEKIVDWSCLAVLVFIDESGYPRPTDNNLYSALLAVCIPENEIRILTNKLYKLKARIYKNDDEIKATSVINRQTINKNRSNNRKYAEDFIKLTSKMDIKTFCVIMKRPEKEVLVGSGILPKHYQILMKKVEYYSEVKNLGKLVFVFDEVSEKEDERIAKSFNHFLFTSNLGKQFKNILETPLFVSSKITPAIQIADMYVSVVRQYFENGLHEKRAETDFEKWIAKLYNIVKTTTENYMQPDNTYYEYGFQEINNLNYVKKVNKILDKTI